MGGKNLGQRPGMGKVSIDGKKRSDDYGIRKGSLRKGGLLRKIVAKREKASGKGNHRTLV